MWVNKYIDDCTDEDLNDRDFIASVVDRAIFHFAINSICNPGDNKDATPIERCTFDVETKNDLPSTVQLFYEESKDNEPLANIHFQAIGSGFLTFVNACQEHDDNSLKLFASLLISLSYSSAYTDLAGAEKVSLNSQAVKNPSLITEGARIFGNQCIVLGMDAAKDDSMPSGYRVFINGGRVATELDALDWAKKAVSLGAGEIVLNSIDADGTKNGYETTLTKMIAENVSVPVIASGGGGKISHLKDVLTNGKADAALIATMVHSGEYTVESIKKELYLENIPVRMQ